MAIKLNDILIARAAFALMDDSQISGSFHVVSSVAALQDVPSYVRKAGMFGSVSGSLYYLDQDLVTWVHFTGSSGGGGGSLNPTGSAGTYSAVKVNEFGQVTSGSTAAPATFTAAITASSPLRIDGGPSARLDADRTISIPTASISNNLLVNPFLSTSVGNGLTGGGVIGLGDQVSFGLTPSGSAGTYNTVTTDAFGRVTSGSNVNYALSGNYQISGNYVPDSRTLSPGNGLAGGGDLSTDRTLGLTASGTAGTYNNITIDAFGRATSGSNVNYGLSGSYAPAARQILTTSGLTGGGDLTADRTISLTVSGTAGTYNTVVVDTRGRVSSGSNTNYALSGNYQVSGNYVADTRQVLAGTGLTGGGDLSVDRTLGLSTSGTAGTYNQIVVDPYGRVSSGTNQPYITGVYISASFSASLGNGLQGSGPLTGSRLVISLTPSGTAGTYNTITVDAFGRVTSGSNVGASTGVYVSASFSASMGNGLQGSGPLTGSILTISLTPSGTAGTYNTITVDAFGRVTSGSNVGAATGVYVSASFSASMGNGLQGSGPLTGSVLTISLTPSGTAGTYNNVTVDAFGRATGGSNQPYITGVYVSASFSASLGNGLQGSGPLTGTQVVISLTPSGTAGTYTTLVADSFGRISSGSFQTNVSASFQLIAGNGLQGTGPFTGSQVVVSLTPSGTAGTYNNVTVDAFGRVMSGSNTAATSFIAAVTASSPLRIDGGNAARLDADRTLTIASASITNSLISASFISSSAGNGLTVNSPVVSLGSQLSYGLTASGTAGTFNNITVDAFGRATGGSNQPYVTGVYVSASFSASLGNGLQGSGPLTGTQVVISLTPSGTAGTYTTILVDAFGRATSGSFQSNVSASYGFTAGNGLQGTGIHTGSTLVVSLTPSGTAGTYNNITVDAFGRSTGGSNQPYITGVYVSASFSASLGNGLQGSGPLTGTQVVISLTPSGTAGTYTTIIADAFGRISSGSFQTNVSASFQVIAGNGLQGTGPHTGSQIVLSLTPSGTAGTYNQITVDAFGRASGGANQPYITGVYVSASFSASLGNGLQGSGPLTGTQAVISLTLSGTAGTYTTLVADAFGRISSGSFQTNVSASFQVIAGNGLQGTGPHTGSQIVISLTPSGAAGTYNSSLQFDAFGRFMSGSTAGATGGGYIAAVTGTSPIRIDGGTSARWDSDHTISIASASIANSLIFASFISASVGNGLTVNSPVVSLGSQLSYGLTPSGTAGTYNSDIQFDAFGRFMSGSTAAPGGSYVAAVTGTAPIRIDGAATARWDGDHTISIASGGITNSLISSSFLSMSAGNGMTISPTVPSLGSTVTIGLTPSGTAGTFNSSLQFDAFGRFMSGSTAGGGGGLSVWREKLNPSEAQFQTSSFPNFVRASGSNFPVAGLSFSSGSNSIATWAVAATNFGGGSLTCNLFWYGILGTTGNVVWGVKVAALTPGTDTVDIEKATMGGETFYTASHPGTTVKRLLSSSFVINDNNSLSNGDLFYISVRRAALNNRNDTLTGSVILVMAEVNWTGV